MPWRLPLSGRAVPWPSIALSWLGNSRLLKYAGQLLPSIALASDIEDVVYINYLVDAGKAEALVPEGLELRRLGKNGEYALFSILTYRHGHFGPRFLGALRKLLPSPLQSNWRIHVRDPETGATGIYFVTTALNNKFLALAARALSDGVPMHVPERAILDVDDTGTINIVLAPGDGSAPDMTARLGPCSDQQFPGVFPECFQDFDEFLSYCVPQDRALSSQPWYHQVTSQEIELGIDRRDCQPLEGEVDSRALPTLLSIDGASASSSLSRPLCFRVPRVNFVFDKVIRRVGKHGIGI